MGHPPICFRMPTAAMEGGRYIMYDAEFVGPSPNLSQTLRVGRASLGILPARTTAQTKACGSGGLRSRLCEPVSKTQV